MEYYSLIWMPTNFLAHHGIKGMKWGVRRYQNSDGSLTAAGQKRYYGSADKIQKDIDSFKGHEKGIYDKKGRTLLSETDVRNSVKALEIVRDKAKQKGDAKRNKDYQKIKKKEANSKSSFSKSIKDKTRLVANKSKEKMKDVSNSEIGKRGKAAFDVMLNGDTDWMGSPIYSQDLKTEIKNRGKAALERLMYSEEQINDKKFFGSYNPFD
jgi:hypothetical protein